jgi:DNA-binding FadR family transcriptional regulator
MMHAMHETSARTPAEAPPWESDAVAHPLVKQPVKQVAAQVFARIASGAYSYGTRLPAERELAQEFSESRNTIRQAMDFLEVYGVVARRAGFGSFVTYRKSAQDRKGAEAEDDPGVINISAIAETVSPFEMNVAESILEPEIARLATLYMSIRDLSSLRALLNELEEIVADAGRFAHLEKQFMMTLCNGTHNSAIVTMYRVLHEVRKQPQWCANKKRTLTPDRIREAQRALRSLFTALERRDVDNAVECMRLYLSSAQEDMIYAAS